MGEVTKGKRMLARERVAILLQFKEPDRIGPEDEYWIDTLSRREEGLPVTATPSDYFSFDFDRLYVDASLRLTPEISAETDEYTIREDKHGYTAKVWKGKCVARTCLCEGDVQRAHGSSHGHRRESVREGNQARGVVSV